MNSKAIVLSSLLAIGLATPAFAVDPAVDSANGGKLAKRWCAACHVVSTEQQSGTTQAPPFSSIANRPGFDPAKIVMFLETPHPKMPDMNLSRSEASDLAAYIMDQGK